MLTASQQDAQLHANAQLDTKVIPLFPVRKASVNMTMSVHTTWPASILTAEILALELVDRIPFVKSEIIVLSAPVSKDLEVIL